MTAAQNQAENELREALGEFLDARIYSVAPTTEAGEVLRPAWSDGDLIDGIVALAREHIGPPF